MVNRCEKSNSTEYDCKIELHKWSVWINPFLHTLYFFALCLTCDQKYEDKECQQK